MSKCKMKPKRKEDIPTQSSCGICHQLIYFNVDNYCQLKDFKKGKFFCEGFYHTQCYNNKLTDGKEVGLMKRKAWALLNKAEKLIGIDDEPQVVRI